MGCCCSRESESQEEPLIPDVEKIIADYTWQKFLAVSGRLQRLRMRRKHYTVEVPMNYFHFAETSVPKVDPLSQLAVTGHAATKSTSERSPKRYKDKVIHPERTHLEHKFVNRTDEEQKYEFRFEKVRTGSVNVSYQKGFSIGGKASFALDLAHVPGLEIESRYEVRKESQQSFDETLTTSITSEVKVSAHSARTAIVMLEERRIHAEFEVTVSMTMPAGKAVAYVKNKDGEKVHTRQINNLNFVFKGKHKTKELGGKAAEFVVKGIVEGSVLSSHQICLQDAEDVDMEEAPEEAVVSAVVED